MYSVHSEVAAAPAAAQRRRDGAGLSGAEAFFALLAEQRAGPGIDFVG